MDGRDENNFLSYNKYLEEKLEQLLHYIECRLDKLHENCDTDKKRPSPSSIDNRIALVNNVKTSNPFTIRSFLTFKAPYIRDFRNFSAPLNEDVKQIKQLNGTENIDLLIKTKSWTKDTKQQLKEAVLDHYATIHLLKLIKQKNQLLGAPLSQNNEDIVQKLRLIDEQTEQVRSRKEPRIFLPEDRVDSQIDWFAISAKITSHHDAQDCQLMWSNSLHSSVNDGIWTKEEDICLINAVAKHGKHDWDLVARDLNSNRLAWQCCARYNREYAFIPMAMDEDDANKIIEVINLCRIGNYVPWNQVMYFVQYHGLLQVKYQWHKYRLEQKAKEPWSHTEDLLLMNAVEKCGEKHWSRVADSIPGRTNKSCRERYMMRMKYSKRVIGRWTKHEDKRLIDLIEKFGSNYSLISAHFPYRNLHQLRSRHEALKNEITGKVPSGIKRRIFYRNSTNELVSAATRRLKTTSEIEVDRQLYEIFSTYRKVNKVSNKSLICRSYQDEVIYQTLVRVLCDTLLERDSEEQMLQIIIKKAINNKPGLLTPCVSTLRGFKAWNLQQDYLKQLNGSKFSETEDIEIDEQVLKIIVSIFLWPAVLSTVKVPNIDATTYQTNSMIERDSKNLYKIREIQKHIIE